MKIRSQIDRRSYEPPYLQLANILQEQIASGIYLPGSRLPSESKLCRTYHVSPMTVRRSIKDLVGRKIVRTIRGSGTYVKGPVLGGVTFDLQEFHQLFKARDKTRVKILEVSIIKADEGIARKLSLKPGDPTILIIRLLIQNEDPIIYHTEHIIYDPSRPIVEAEMEVTSLHGLFDGGGETDLKRGELTIQAAVLTKEEAERLHTAEGLPAFRLEHVFYDFHDKPVSWGQFICRGDRIQFSANVGIFSHSEVKPRK